MQLPLDLFRRRDRVTVLRLEGVIGAGPRFGAAALTDAALAPLIEAAFRRGRPTAVAVTINSPGGSPAQSSLIAARIRRLADETQAAGPRLRRGRGRLRRLLAGDRRRRHPRRSEQHRRLDRRDLGLLRLPGAHRPPRGRTPGAHRRRGQEPARPLPARAARGRRAPHPAAGGDPRQLHRAGEGPPRRPARRRRPLHRRGVDRPGGGRARPRRRGRPPRAGDEGPLRRQGPLPDDRSAPAAVPPARGPGHRRRGRCRRGRSVTGDATG